MQPDPWSLYRQMLKSRLFEEAVTRLWVDGRIFGEMHLGTGEEAICAGVVDHLIEGDAMALDHRGTPPLLMRGLDPVLLLREFLGRSDGLCAGLGGHMHLFWPERLAASSGIVGAAAPAAVGFALAAQQLRPGTVSVAFFGEGAMNQGMVLESMNLAAAWKLPVLFVCKDNEWAITTTSSSVTGGNLPDRALSFGLYVDQADGLDVEAVWYAAHGAFHHARNGEGPAFLYARCRHLEGHFLGDPMLRVVRHPLKEMSRMTVPLLKAFAARRGAPFGERWDSLKSILAALNQAKIEQSANHDDPVARTRSTLLANEARLLQLEESVSAEVNEIVQEALAPAL